MSLLLDVASIPRARRNRASATTTTSAQTDVAKKLSSKKTCIPGDKLFPIDDGYCPGFGTYEERRWIVASTCGYVSIVEDKTKEAGGKQTLKTVEVHHGSDGKRYICPVVGAVVTAEVRTIQSKAAKCLIFAVEDSLLPVDFPATLRKEDVRENEYNKQHMWEYVKPGDIILARVLGIGDIQSSYLLTISEDLLGVVNANGDNGEKLLPFNSGTVKSEISGYTEPRKVALVPNLNKI